MCFTKMRTPLSSSVDNPLECGLNHCVYNTCQYLVCEYFRFTMVFSDVPDMSDSSHDFVQKDREGQVPPPPPSLPWSLSNLYLFRMVGVVVTMTTEMGMAMVHTEEQIHKVVPDKRIQDDFLDQDKMMEDALIHLPQMEIIAPLPHPPHTLSHIIT